MTEQEETNIDLAFGNRLCAELFDFHAEHILFGFQEFLLSHDEPVLLFQMILFGFNRLPFPAHLGFFFLCLADGRLEVRDSQ